MSGGAIQGSPNFYADIPVPQCANHYPPTPGTPWFVLVCDEATEDGGSIEYFSVAGPDGREFESPGPRSTTPTTTWTESFS